MSSRRKEEYILVSNRWIRISKSWVTKLRTNAFRRKITEKKATLQELDNAIKKLQDDLRKES